MKKTVLAIGAHPDDIEIGCGGTIAVLQERGYELVHLVVTSGEQGSLSVPMAKTAQKREREAEESARILGASRVIFLREPDGLTSFSLEAKIRLVSTLREIRPDIVFTHARSDQFPDHQVVHHLTRAAITAAAGPWYPEAPGMPHHVTTVLGYEVWHPASDYQMAFDITSAMGRKISALRVHVSQVNDIDYVGAVEGLAKYRGAMTMTGKFAEVFEVLKMGEI